MKLVLLAGGFGTRLAGETALRPKPMVEIGGRPILWHIMKIYAHHGVRDFVICLGYMGYMIKEYFFNYALHHADVTIDLETASVDYHGPDAEPWKVTLVDTGHDSMTGGRLRRVGGYLEPDEPFFLTYGDGVADIDIREQLRFHLEHGKAATLAAVRPPGRFGAVSLRDDLVTEFLEKPSAHDGYISGGFFVLSTKVLGLLDGDDTIWEEEPLRALAEAGDLMAYRHDGFWQCLDTPRDLVRLQSLWDAEEAPWRVW